MQKFFSLILLTALITGLTAQNPVPAGKGSYAEYTPLYKSKTDQHPGDQSRLMENKELFVTERQSGKPVPTNDWWTDLLVSRYSGNLWAYPQVVNAEEYGIYIEYPHRWKADGREMGSDSHLEVTAKRFTPGSASADNWHDWGLEFLMQDQEKQMHVTLAHGIPFTWIESQNLELQLRYSGGTCSDGTNEISLPVTTGRLVLMLGNDAYGIYAPDGTTFSLKNGMMEIEFSATRQFLVIAVLPDRSCLDDYAEYAYNIPRNTRVTWEYDETAAKLNTLWTVETENLKGLTTQKGTLQGFIPHHYKRSEPDFAFTGYEYDTPRGKMKMASGNRFAITYDFNGILPYFAAPELMPELPNSYRPDRMKEMIAQYARQGNFGADTYWGGKGLTQMALYMTFAYETGETELFETCKNRLKSALIDWFTFTPGEEKFFFARYNRWGALVGYDTSYDSDTFNDHHFHYGYFTYAASLLSLFDKEFQRDYGPMITLLAKDYANWERNDSRFPFFRTLDPWAGHSYAGGLGGWNGNGQESTSEAMQSWGGLYLQGVASGDKTMRDAGIFGWVLESRGTAEYWFDRDRENIDYTRYDKPWSSNLTSAGVGWWTWFSGDPVWMHSIQWMPISPILKYLYEDTDFAAWDYAQMWQAKEVGDWETANGLGQESGLGNVVLSYLQIFDPDSAAAVFDRLWDGNFPLARNADTGGISYFVTHSHRTYGEIQWDIHADLPTSTCYYNRRTEKYTYVVYNPESSERTCTFYKDNRPVVTFKAPAGKLTAYRETPALSSIRILSPVKTVEPGQTAQITATLLDQYGATMAGNVNWTAEGNGTITPDGLFTAASDKGSAVIRATSGNINQELTLRINDKPVLTTAVLSPDIHFLETGKTIAFSLPATDQYGDDFPVKVDWEIVKDGETLKSDSIFDLTGIGTYQIRAKAGNKLVTSDLSVLPPFPNMALGKPAVSSSEENAGTLTASANDGDKTSRWGSAHRDGEWIYIDLTENCYVGYIGILWEAAYASQYEIQVSDNATDWETVHRITGQGGYETAAIDRTTRYVRMLSLQRATQYGTSLYEFEIYGVPASGDPAALFGLDITPKNILLKENESVRLAATGYNRLGQQVAAPVSWQITGGEGTVTPEGILTPTRYGNIAVSASSGTAKAETSFLVEETLKLVSVTLSPKNSSLITGMTQTFEITAEDQFGVPFATDRIDYTVIGEGGHFADGAFTADQSGEFMLIAGKGEIRDTACIHVASITEINLALNKPATASSHENDGLLASYVNDGDMTTRWGSAFNDNEYIEIDLQDNYVIDRIHLYWQTSYATAYRIETSLDDDNWTTVWQQSSSAGGTEEIGFPSVAARYVKLTCLSRNSVYGSSLWEMEIYGTALWQNPVPTRIELLPALSEFYIGEPVLLNIAVYDQYGLPLSVTGGYAFSLNGGGTIGNDGIFTPATAGEYVLTVVYGSLTRDYSIRVLPERKLDRIIITPDGYKLETNESVALAATGFDQYGNPFEIVPLWDADGGVITSDGVFSATRSGSYRITARTASVTGTATVDVFEPSRINLALRKPVETSSALQNAAGAVDGNTGTRWESEHTDSPQWLTVDLQTPAYLTELQIQWEAASAADYEVQGSTDGIAWETLLTVSGKTGARTDLLPVHHTARYLRIYCTKRATQWGYSIIELAAYGVELQAGEPYRIRFTRSRENFSPGESFTFEVAVTDINDSPLSGKPVSWTVSGGGTITPDGLFRATALGQYRVTAVCGGARVSVPISVSTLMETPETRTFQPLIRYKDGIVKIEMPDIRQIALYDLSGRSVYPEIEKYENGWILRTGENHGLHILLIRTSETTVSCKVIL